MLGNNKSTGHYDTILSANIEVVGDIRVSGGLHIDGKVKGNIVAVDNSNAMVRISEKGSVEGCIRVPKVIINGSVVGDVYASSHVELAQKAVINGNLYYNLMEMVLGAQVNGNVVYQPEQNGKKGLFSGQAKESTAVNASES